MTQKETTRRDKLEVALVEFDVRPGDVALNEATVSKMLDECAACGAELVVLPELWNTGYDLARLPELAQDMQGSSSRLLADKAREYGMYIFGGTIAEKRGGAFYNTALVYNDKGELIKKYRKIHLFPNGLKEDKYFTPGDEWGLVDTPWGRFGIAVCYDLRFPATIQNLALRGANTIIVPAQWPTIRADHWLLLAQARAVENQVFLLGCNRIGRDASGRYSGRSVAVDALGQVLCGGFDDDKPGIFFATLDYSNMEKIRTAIPVYDDRKPILDEIDDSQL